MGIVPHDTNGVNGDRVDADRMRVAGRDLGGDRETRTIATLGLLSEGVQDCDDCGRRIDGEAVYITRNRPLPPGLKRVSYKLLALLCPDCWGAAALRDLRSRGVLGG